MPVELHFCVMITENVHPTFAAENEIRKGIAANPIIHIGERIDWSNPLMESAVPLTFPLFIA